MKDDGLRDGRKIPDEVMEHLRRRAVHAIREKGHSPEVVAAAFGFSCSSIYEWLDRYDRGGYEALDSRPALGLTRSSRTRWTPSSKKSSCSPPRGIMVAIPYSGTATC